MGRSVVLFVVLLAALAGPASAREPDVPPSQAAFRAALTKYYEKCQKETDQARFGELQRARAAAFTQVLGEDLSFEGWRLEFKGIEPTPRGGYFVRFIDPALADLRAVRPTYWNGGPGKIGRETAILPNSELHDILKGMRPGMQAIVSGQFFAGEDGGPLFESSKTTFQANEAEKAKFRMPYFSVRLTREPMASTADNLLEAVRRLERQPLRNIVLLKHIEAFPRHVSVTQVCDGPDTATLVLLDTAGSIYDRETYPQAAFVALISSDRAPLTRRLLRSLPARGHVVFKLASDGDREVVAERFPISRATSFLSFTGDEQATYVADNQVSVSRSASDEVLRLLASQGHPRDWLLPLLASNRAFVCALEHDTEPRSICIAFENHRQIWEVGGVLTPAAHRSQGFAARVVRKALAELQRRKLLARYQVNEDNLPSIRLATSAGLRQFLQLTHFRTW